MLSRREVCEAQGEQQTLCWDCIHKPTNDFCQEQLVFGEQRMDWCLDYLSKRKYQYDPWPIEKEKSKRMLRPEK
jgi:hypothetical protein